MCERKRTKTNTKRNMKLGELKLVANKEKIAKHLEQSLMLITALKPVIGYENCAKIAHHAHESGKTLKESALELKLVDENVFDGMKVQISKSEQRKRREPFTSEELKKILKPNTYLKWTKNFKHRWSDITTNQNPYYWVFLIGIFSGMRTNEICQLRTSDVFEEDGFSCVRWTGAG